MPISIGLIESKGLVALVEAADVILKNSPVKIIGIHKLDNGLVSLALSGSPDYIDAAIESGVSAGQKVGEIYSYSIVHNPAKEILELFSELYPENKINPKTAEPVNVGSEINIDEKVLETINTEPVQANRLEEKVQKTSKPAQAKVKKQLIKTQNKKTEKKVEISANPAVEFSEVTDSNLIEDKSVIDKPLSTIERLRKEALGIKSQKSKIHFNLVNENKLSIESANSKGPGFENEINFKLIDTMNVHKLRNYARSFPDFPIRGREISRANRLELVEYFKKLKSSEKIEE